MKLTIWEDNQACITVCVTGYSPKLRHIQRTHKVNLGSIHELINLPEISLLYIVTDAQAADIFTKPLVPAKWPNAIELLHINIDPLPNPSDGKTTHTGAERIPPPEPEPEPRDTVQAGPIEKAVKALAAKAATISQAIPFGYAAAVNAVKDCRQFLCRATSYKTIKEDSQRRLAHAKVEAGKFTSRRARVSGNLSHSRTLWEICTSPESTLGEAASEYEKVEVCRVGLGDKDVIDTLEGCAEHPVSKKKIVERINLRGGADKLIPPIRSMQL